ncbi:MAG: zinc ribbon domain-containing protein [Eubacteriales bacterium]|nr:zinc ribbon domain-containing protein [Eubacteriales bacterium]
MFNKPGRVLKFVAVGTFFTETLASIITAVVIWFNFEDFLIGLGVLVGGVIVAYISALLLYSFGHLVENSDASVYIASKSTGIKPEITDFSFKNQITFEKKQHTQYIPEGMIACPKCGTPNDKYNKYCTHCLYILSNDN